MDRFYHSHREAIIVSIQSTLRRILSLVLVLSIVLTMVACSGASRDASTYDPNSRVHVENIKTENILTETLLTEFITQEIYLEELIIAEHKIAELLLEESSISEVILCKTIYVPQDHIADYSANSLTAQLFGDDVNITSLLTKIAVGTGVIVTVVVLKKLGLSDPVASVVTAAADQSLKFAATGAVVGSLFGGLTGATDELDQSGRTSAVIGFAAATVGLILSVVGLVAAAPTGGSSAITAAAGIKLVLAGISVLAATAGTAYAGHKAVKAFTATDSTDIDWDNIDWQKVGASSATKAISNGADGYMWGSIIGLVHGGAEGYDFYHKHHTPYTQYNARLQQTPKEGNMGKWSGDRGESDFILDKPIKLSDGTKITQVTYKNAVPDFSPYQKAQVKISGITNSRWKNFNQADKALAQRWTKIQYEGQSWTAPQVEAYRTGNHLTWHEMSNMDSMQLVPQQVNQTFTHWGGVAEYNAMVGQDGATEFD